jgi:prepilin-type N-terminal cleavage/methylation domain-containing protein
MMRREQGFTLIELLVVVAITGVLCTVIGSVLFQLTRVSGYGNDRLTAIHELQNTAFWFNQDGQMAVAATGGTSLVLSLPAGQITYALVGASFRRTMDGNTITLAQNISEAVFLVQGRLVSMNVTSSLPGRIEVHEQNVYQVYLRPVQQ